MINEKYPSVNFNNELLRTRVKDIFYLSFSNAKTKVVNCRQKKNKRLLIFRLVDPECVFRESKLSIIFLEIIHKLPLRWFQRSNWSKTNPDSAWVKRTTTWTEASLLRDRINEKFFAETVFLLWIRMSRISRGHPRILLKSESSAGFCFWTFFVLGPKGFPKSGFLCEDECRQLSTSKLKSYSNEPCFGGVKN